MSTTSKPNRGDTCVSAIFRNTSRNKRAHQISKNRRKLSLQTNIYVKILNAESKTWAPVIDAFEIESGSGVLNREQLAKLLKVMNKGIEPEEDELDFILQVSSKNQSGEIRKDELERVVGTWMALKNDLPYIKSMMDKYDTKNAGVLDFEDLRGMMADLNGGIIPSEEEVGIVMGIANTGSSNTGSVGKFEVRHAIEYWYASAALTNHVKKESKPKLEHPKGHCTIS